jgi:hypothetical protein
MIVDDIAAALPELRRQAESLMADTFTAYAPDGTTTDAYGDEVPAYTPEGSTFGKVQGTTARDPITRTVVIGGVDRPVVEGGLQIPLSAPVPVAGPRGTGWEYVCTAVGPLSDPALLGTRWLVVNAPTKSYATARRLDVAEVPQ